MGRARRFDSGYKKRNRQYIESPTTIREHGAPEQCQACVGCPPPYAKRTLLRMWHGRRGKVTLSGDSLGTPFFRTKLIIHSKKCEVSASHNHKQPQKPLAHSHNHLRLFVDGIPFFRVRGRFYLRPFLQSLPTHPRIGRRSFRPLVEIDGLPELVCIVVDVGPSVELYRSGCPLDISGTQSGERRDSASVYGRDLEIELM
jgi:hypothetical protein